MTEVQLIRGHGLVNVRAIISAARKAGLPLEAACALMQKESSGHNVYGHDVGGALSGYPEPVDESNYKVFRWLVIDQGHASNGVGPAQLTYPGFFTDMEKQGLSPWLPADNMFYGFRLLKGYFDATHSWRAAGTKYNGATTYGADLASKVATWRQWLAQA